MGDTIIGKAVRARAAAMAISPATLEDLEADVSCTGGLAYGFLALKAPAILDGSRNANPLCFGDLWAFDIDDFVLVTSIPYGMGPRYRDAQDVLEAALRRSLQVARCDEAAQNSQLILDTSWGVSRAGTSAAGRPSPNPASPAGDRGPAQLDAILSSYHYTALPAWLLDGRAELTISERILLADILDVTASGCVLSYMVEYDRIRSRTGLKATTVAHALRGLCAHGVLARVARTKGRYTLSWEALADLARRSPLGSEAVGAAMTEADVRRRLTNRRRSLAVPNWAVELCGATEAALLLSKGWAMAHGSSDGTVWASGTTLSRWLPGAERSLRRARSFLFDNGLAHATPQYSSLRTYANGRAPRPNHTVEFRVDARLVARALVVRGFDFGHGATSAVMALFENDSALRADAARWDRERDDRSRIRRLRATLARSAAQGSPVALLARTMIDHGSTSRGPAPWRPSAPLRALPSPGAV